MSETAGKTPSKLVKMLKKEAALFAGLFFFGLAILPIAIWFVGKSLFGAYDGAGYGTFFGALSGKIRAGDLAAWFLVLSPWLVWQCLRLMALGWRTAART